MRDQIDCLARGPSCALPVSGHPLKSESTKTSFPMQHAYYEGCALRPLVACGAMWAHVEIRRIASGMTW